jgi:hypothetical protein
MSDLIQQDKINALQDAVAAAPQVELEMKEYVSGNVYVRELRIPAGIIVVGKVHKHESIGISIGDIVLVDQDGSRRLTGIHSAPAPKGTKRVALAIEDSIFFSCHSIPDDADDIENYLVCNTFDDYKCYLEKVDCDVPVIESSDKDMIDDVLKARVELVGGEVL